MDWNDIFNDLRDRLEKRAEAAGMSFSQTDLTGAVRWKLRPVNNEGDVRRLIIDVMGYRAGEAHITTLDAEEKEKEDTAGVEFSFRFEVNTDPPRVLVGGTTYDDPADAADEIFEMLSSGDPPVDHGY